MTTIINNNSNNNIIYIPCFSSWIFFDQHSLVVSDSCSRAGSELHLMLVLDNFAVSSTQAPIANWYQRRAEQKRHLPISPIPSMMCMIRRYSGSVNGDRASDAFPFPCTSAFLMALIRVVMRFDLVGLPRRRSSWYLH